MGSLTERHGQNLTMSCAVSIIPVFEVNRTPEGRKMSAVLGPQALVSVVDSPGTYAPFAVRP